MRIWGETAGRCGGLFLVFHVKFRDDEFVRRERYAFRDAFRRFFRTGEARQFAYANASNAVSVLSVKVGKDIHEIHPATHCLRSGGWFVESDGPRRVELPGRAAPFQVTEAIVQKGGMRALVWIWYSTDKLSVGSFLRFRQLYSRNEAWHGFQVMTSLGLEDQSLVRKRQELAAFLARGRTAHFN